jgi:protein TonB
MKVAAGISALLHALLLGAVLAQWRWQPAGPAEVPARIEMVFGSNALIQGPPARRAPAAVPAPPVAAAAPTPPADSGVLPPSMPTNPSVQSQPVVAPPAAAQPVRLGDGLVGFDVPTPDANIVEAQGDPTNRPPPPPDAAFARGEHGRTILRIHVRPDGLVGDIETLQSSGYADLDADAIRAARGWHFLPVLRDGEAVASVRDQAFDFELR